MAGKTPRKPWALLAYTVADDYTEGAVVDVPAQNELKAIFESCAERQVSVAAQVDFKSIPGVIRASVREPVLAGDRAFDELPPEKYPLWLEILKKKDARDSAPGEPESLTGRLPLQAALLAKRKVTVGRERIDLHSARKQVLQDFLRAAQRSCPAEQYVLFVYGHSAGPMGLFWDRGPRNQVPSTLRINHLAASIAAMQRRAALVMFRDCFMGALEAVFQLQGISDFMLASQTQVPIAGEWPWRDLLGTLTRRATPRTVATKLAANLGVFLEGFLDGPLNRDGSRIKFEDAPMALLDLTRASAIAAPLKELSTALGEARKDPRRRTACAAALETARMAYPGDPAMLDVLTMCENLAALKPDPVARPAMRLGKTVQALLRWTHSRTGRYRGVGLFYLPATSKLAAESNIVAGDEDGLAADAAYYARLALSRATGWHRVALNPLTTRG